MALAASLKHTAFSALALGAKALRGRTDGQEDDLRALKQFVLLQYAPALGSVVHATPLVAALRAAVPQANIIVCASGFARELYRGNPAVDRLVETPDPTGELWPAIAAIRRALPAGRFATLTTPSSDRSAVGLAAVLAGARNLVGFTLVPQLYRAPLTFDQNQSQIANHLRIVETLGHGEAGGSATHFEPQVFFSVDDLEYARQLVGRFDKPSRPLAVLVTQTSVTQRKSWRAERFVAVAQVLRERHSMNVVLVGSSSEREAVARLVEQTPEQITEPIGSAQGAQNDVRADVQNVAGETSLPQLAALLSLCRVGVTLDTGTMHIGRAVGLPMVIIAPAWSPPLEWLPVSDARFVILKNLDMSPSQMPGDYIIDEVSVEEVLAAVDHLLGSSGAAAEAR